MDETKRCPFCDETIRMAAIKCKHCASMLDGSEALPGARRAQDTGRTGTPAPSAYSGGPGQVPDWWHFAGPLRPGTEIREYRIEKLLGKGGMGEVYLASHTLTAQQSAVKVISPELLQDEGIRSRFMEEARVMAHLRHPNIVQFNTFFPEGNRFFLVMEYIDGPTVEHMVETQPLDIERARDITLPVLAALDYAHSRIEPVVHRDIKPANIMVTSDDRVVVTDFGIAKAANREKLTRTRGIVGSYEFMSPEQIQGKAIGPQSDIYAVGISLYQMLTGVVPFRQQSETGLECMNAHVHKSPPPLSDFREGIPQALQRVVTKALAKQPGERFASALEMADAMEKALGDEPPEVVEKASTTHEPRPVPEPSTGLPASHAPYLPKPRENIPSRKMRFDTDPSFEDGSYRRNGLGWLRFGAAIGTLTGLCGYAFWNAWGGVVGGVCWGLLMGTVAGGLLIPVRERLDLVPALDVILGAVVGAVVGAIGWGVLGGGLGLVLGAVVAGMGPMRWSVLPTSAYAGAVSGVILGACCARTIGAYGGLLGGIGWGGGIGLAIGIAAGSTRGVAKSAQATVRPVFVAVGLAGLGLVGWALKGFLVGIVAGTAVVLAADNLDRKEG